MTLPTVTELPQVLEPVTPDTFIPRAAPFAGSWPIPSRRIVD